MAVQSPDNPRRTHRAAKMGSGRSRPHEGLPLSAVLAFAALLTAAPALAQQPDLQAQISSVYPNPVLAGQSVTVTASIGNMGDGAVSNVSLRLEFPGATLVSSTAACTPMGWPEPSYWECPVGGLSPYQPPAMGVTFQFTAPITAGPVNVRALPFIVGPEIDSNPTNDEALQQITVDPATIMVMPFFPSTVWLVGTMQTIQFNHTLPMGQNVTFEVTRNGGSSWEMIGSKTIYTQGYDSFMWYVSGPDTNQGQIRVSWMADPGTYGLSSPVMIASVPAQPVVNTIDDISNGLCTTLHCSLREAIEAVNSGAVAPFITFNIPSPATAPYVIHLLSSLPPLTRTVTIDGTSQPGYSGEPIVEIRGSFIGFWPSGLQVQAGASSSIIRGLSLKDFQGFSGAISVEALQVTIEQNYIGVNAADIAAGSSTGFLPDGNYIGIQLGPGASYAAIRYNVISGNSSAGIWISPGLNSYLNTITSNFIGTDRTATVAIPNNVGIWVASSGGTDISANVIANNQQVGVRIFDGAVSASVRANSMFNNSTQGYCGYLAMTGCPGLDIGPSGVTPNDPLDGDTGPNLLQNFPDLTSASGDETSLTVTGSISTTPNSAASIQFYSSPACHPSGHGEGKVYLGEIYPVWTDGNGYGAISAVFHGVAAGHVITATAEVGWGGTSEFSNCVAPGLQLSIGDQTHIPEGSGSSQVMFTVSLNLPAPYPVTVDYMTESGSAISGTDFQPASGTLTFPVGTQTLEIPVTIYGNATHEPDRTFYVNLSNPIGAGVPSSQATGTIVDDDPETSHTVTVTFGGAGAGQVTSIPVGVNCVAAGPACSAGFAVDEVVTLAASASGQSTFTGWTGCDTTAGNECTVTLNADRAVSAAFAAPVTLWVATSGAGLGTVTDPVTGVSCGVGGATCSALVAVGTTVTLSASASDLSTFTGWTGCDTTAGNQCTVVLSVDRAVSATFAAPV
ncbi:MAG: Calx-beta domain-containing protein, partial [Vicinamibacteria bacterium]